MYTVYYNTYLEKIRKVKPNLLIIGRWYEFGHVNTKIAIGMFTGLGSSFIVYLFCTPRKVSKTNIALSIACANHFRQVLDQVKITKHIIILQNIGRKGTKNTVESSMGYL